MCGQQLHVNMMFDSRGDVGCVIIGGEVEIDGSVCEKSLDLLEKGGSGREGMCRMIVMIVMIVVIVVITVAMTAMIVTMMITAPTTTDVMIAIAAMIARNTPC